MRRSTTRYEIVFLPPADAPPVMMHANANADDATVLFAEEVQRLLADRASGMLVIHRKASNNATPDVVVRQVLPFAQP